jgi:hypothetical protein
VSKDRAEEMIELILAAGSNQSGGELVRLGLAERETGVLEAIAEGC